MCSQPMSPDVRIEKDLKREGTVLCTLTKKRLTGWLKSDPSDQLDKTCVG